MYTELLQSDRKKAKDVLRSNSISSMFMLANDQVLLSRHVTSISNKNAILPPLDSIMVAIHLGGKQVTEQSGTLHISLPNNITFMPPSGEMVCRFHGVADIVFLFIAGGAKQRILASVSKDQKVKFTDTLIVSIVRQLSAESVRSDRDRNYCDCLMETIIEHLIHLLKDKQTQRLNTESLHSQQIHKVINYIHQNLKKTLTVEQLAKIAELHRSWLPKLFKRVTGLTVRRFVIKQRLELARDMLANTDINLSQLTHEIGFSTQSHFTESFKQFYGQTPLQYRKSLS